VTVRPHRPLRRVLLIFACLWGVCLSGGQVDAARWQDHRASALRAVDQADTRKAIEQFEAAIYFAEDQLAADRDIAELWEHLTAAYLAEGQFRRAWDATVRWDTLLAANAAEPWAPEQQRRRDQMTKLLFEQTRKTPNGDMDTLEAAGAPATATVAAAGERPAPDPAAEPVPQPMAAASEHPTPDPLPAGEPVRTAAAPPGEAAPELDPEPSQKPRPEPHPEATTYGVHLASFKSESNARTGWTQLQARYPDVLNGKTLALRSVDLGDRGTFVRVIAVPYANSAAARAVCRDLEHREQYCAVMRPD